MTSADSSGQARHWVWYVNLWGGLLLSIIVILIAVRFVLLIAGASAASGFVEFIYDITDPLVRPFEGIFDEQTVGDDGVFEPESIIAIVVYSIAGLIIGAILRTIVASSSPRRVDTWRADASDIYVGLSTLHGSLAAAAATPEAADPAAVSRIAGSADLEIDQYSAALHTLELNPPSDRAGAATRDVILSLNEVRAAMRADTGTMAPSTTIGAATSLPGQSRSALRASLADLDVALQTFRAAL
jgi:uncharacterized protein YggT (Ycf19 family)